MSRERLGKRRPDPQGGERSPRGPPTQGKGRDPDGISGFQTSPQCSACILLPAELPWTPLIESLLCSSTNILYANLTENTPFLS